MRCKDVVRAALMIGLGGMLSVPFSLVNLIIMGFGILILDICL